MNMQTNNNNDHLYEISDRGKVKVDLERKVDRFDKTYYTGELQFPGTIDFSYGVSFMVFISDTGAEQLHIAPMDPRRLDDPHPTIRFKKTAHGEDIAISLFAKTDRFGKTYYAGQTVNSRVIIPLAKGVFIRFYLGDTTPDEYGRQRLPEIQIGDLNQDLVKNRKAFIREQKQLQQRATSAD